MMPIGKRDRRLVSLVWFISLIVVWELIAFALVHIFHDQMAATKLPYPHSIMITFFKNWQQLLEAGGVTLSRAVVGFVLGTLIGYLLAILMSLSKQVERVALPYLIVSQMIPILGLAPIIFNLVRDMNTARIVISAYITFFPVAVNTLSGFKSVENDKKELLYALATTKPSVYFKLMIPYSLPYLFVGLKIAAPMSVTASILIDMLGSSSGIGVKLLYSLYTGSADIFWASVVTSGLMGVASYYIIVLMEQLCMPWKRVSMQKVGGH